MTVAHELEVSMSLSITVWLIFSNESILEESSILAENLGCEIEAGRTEWEK